MTDRYYSPDDPGGSFGSVTPAEFAILRGEDQLKYMVYWFNQNYEDPQNEMPYADKDSPHNYEYIWGGPYDALEELGDEFGPFVSDETLQAAVDAVQNDGTYEWAPTSRHPNRRDLDADEDINSDDEDSDSITTLEEIEARLSAGVTPHFGDDYDRDTRASLRAELSELRRLLQARSDVRRGQIGHNNPPELIDGESEIDASLNASIDIIDRELSSPTPDLATVVRSMGAVKRALSWFLEKMDRAVNKAIDVATPMVVLYGAAHVEKLSDVYAGILEWLNNVTLPF